jgi:phage gpG-like protein
MFYRFYVQVDGLEQLVGAIEGLRRDIEEPQSILEAVAERAFYPIVQEIFDSEGRGNWEDLTTSYEASKRARYGDKLIMQRTGALVTSLSKGGAAMNIQTAQGRDMLLVGSSIPYSAAASKKRPIFIFNQGDYAQMGDVAVDELGSRAKDKGFQVEKR